MYCWRNKIVGCLFVVIAVVGFWSCSNPPKYATFYNVDSLVTVQIKHLTTAHAKLSKEAIVGSEKDAHTYEPADSAFWEKELSIFREAHAINKPINRDSYIVDDGLTDISSNLTVKAFSCTEDLPVRYLRIFYQRSPDSPRKIEILYDDSNTLYRSGRLLTMEFQQIGNKSLLTAYSIKGGQKMILGDTVTFSITGKIFID